MASVEGVKAALIAYPKKHPTASDTLEGIGRWWLPQTLAHSEADVARALDELHAEGRIQKCLKPDGRCLFRMRHTSKRS